MQIDPPYNTGSDFIYRDKFAQSTEEYSEEIGQNDEETGDRLFKNTDSNGRFHSDWCSMIYSRLLLARNLLLDDGVIFISIDDNEADNLKKICDELFGCDCFVANISWQRTYSTRNDSKGIVNEIEHIIVYSKQPNWNPIPLPRTAEMDSKYKNIDNDSTPWTSDNPFAPGAKTHQGMVYAIQHPFTGKLLYPSDNACWRYQQDEMLKIMNGWCEYYLVDLHDEERRAAVCGIASSEIRKGVKGIVLKNSIEQSRIRAKTVYDRGQWPRFYFTKGSQGGIRRKTYLDSVGGKLPTNFWTYEEVGHTDEAKKEIKKLFDGSAPFDTPKPVRLIERMLTISSNADDIILDFFSGSATTAHAIMAKNAVDNCKRKFIMIQVAETSQSPIYPTLCEIGKERIRRAGKKIKEENPLTTVELDTGFRVFKLDDTNMEDVYYSADEYSQQMLFEMQSNIKPDRTDLD
ncbi:MAG: site-specific DNA-methyltransferase, partial [Clostridiales bacterium]|nr:site-specific DNA-methyltransferase [Clostridiales bacterium]